VNKKNKFKKLIMHWEWQWTIRTV